MNEGTQNSLMFPPAALVGSLGDLAKVLVENTEVPEEFCFAAALTVLGSMCGTDLKLNVGCPIEPRLYTIIVGTSYEVKKSTALRRVLEFFAELRPKDSRQIEHTLCVLYGVGSA